MGGGSQKCLLLVMLFFSCYSLGLIWFGTNNGCARREDGICAGHAWSQETTWTAVSALTVILNVFYPRVSCAT